MEWGVHADNLAFRIVPIGMKDDEVNETVAPVEHMEYMELGFTFEPWKDLDVETGDYISGEGTTSMGCAKVKLVQNFGKWNLDSDGKPFTPKLKNREMDLCTVYMSTILHFKLLIENKELLSSEDDVDQSLLNESNYNGDSHKINVGDIKQELPLAQIDIAGPNYIQTSHAGTSVEYPAKTTTIPTIYAEWEGKNSETYEQEDESIGKINSTVNVDYSVLIYAVSYDTFDSSGYELEHDPTFSIFIVTENPGFMAIILIVGGVTLVGVAAFIITKRKNQ